MASTHKKLPWIEWLCHSNFSFLTGASHPEEYIQRAYDLQYRGIGITDFDGLYGIVRAFNARRELLKDDCDYVPQIFYGCEIHMDQDHSSPVVLRKTLVLFALNKKGYSQICKIISYAHRNSKNEAYITLDELAQCSSDHLVCLQPMRGMIRYQTLVKTEAHYRQLQEIFQDRFYLVVSRHLSPSEDLWIGPTIDLAKQIGIPLLMSQDAFFHQASEKIISDLVTAIRLNKTIDTSVPHMFVNDERTLHNITEIHARYHSLPCFHDALANSLDLADRFSFDLTELRYHYPKEMIPEGYTSHQYLEYLVWKAYGKSSNQNLGDTLCKELKLIRILEFADYFLTVWDIVRWAREQDILCQGRGSAANSAVCYMLRITAVDPTSFDLLFERFLSLERGDPPDIDVDFEHERREEVIQYIYQRYGRVRAAMVANVITFRTRGAIRSVGKALGISDSVLSHISNVKKCSDKSLPDIPDKHELPWKLWQTLTDKLVGFPRHMGLHSGGFIISQHELNQIVPQEPATMVDRTVIQWAKDDVESLGLFKIDVLALGMLTAIRKAFKLVQDHYQNDISLTAIPADDPDTYSMIQAAETVGTFQIESRAQMSMLPRLRPKSFYDLVVQIGIIRPGPIQGGLIHPYLKRRHGIEPVSYPHPKLIPILKRTMGVPIFQEQVMRIAMAVGDFTPGEADQLRKQVGAWSLNKDLGDFVEKFARGMRRNGIKEVHIDQLIGHLKGFANYGFPESHSASFALLAYASSYLKCHYQEAFYVALLNSQPMGFYSPHALLQSAKREGSTIKPISLNQSHWDVTIEADEPGVRAIRLGFRLVHGLSKQGAEKLISYREAHGSWTNVHMFLKDCPLHRGDLTALVASNALAELGIGRQEALWLATAVPIAPILDNEEQIALPQEDSLQQVDRDFAAFGTTLGQHPTEVMRQRFWSYPLAENDVKTSKMISRLPNNSMVIVFGMVLVRQQPPTAKGMVFFTLEDQTGYINLVFTPQKAEIFKSIIDRHGFLCAQGRLQVEGRGHSVLVQTVYSPQATSNIIALNPSSPVEDPQATKPPLRRTPRAKNYM